MATEEELNRLYEKLKEVLGLREALTLMELLRPIGWYPPAADLSRAGRSGAFR
ncbi:MAG: hypothetical protein ACYCTI_03305 [Acidimicrobiales bacterium]